VLRAGRPGFDFWQRRGNFSLCHRIQIGCETHPASYPMDNGSSSTGVRRQGREANHPSPSSAKVENAWSYTSNPKHHHGVVLS
jgi:hypothetical protein